MYGAATLMFKHLLDDIHGAFFEDQLVTLNLKSDRYTVYSREQSCAIADLMTLGSMSNNGNAGRRMPKGADLIFKPGFFGSPDRRVQVKSAELCGVSIPCWTLRASDLSAFPNPLLVLRALLLLKKVHRCSKKERIGGLIPLITGALDRRDLRDAVPTQFDAYVLALNVASILYPRRTKCLEWACALILLSAQFGLRSKLVVGVQNRPFYAHAWVESDGYVVGDDPLRRNQLAVILEAGSR